MSSPTALKPDRIGPDSADLTTARAIPSMSQLFRRLWTSSNAPPPANAVIIHDPDARRPHDLDDPFFDRGAQSRIAEVIARARRKK